MDRAEFRRTLAGAARELDAVVRDGPGDAWTVSGGTPACANANGAPWKAIVTLSGDAWGVSPRPASLPWNRRRAAEIAEFRARQLDGLIRAPRKAEPHERLPFAAGPSFSERAAAFAWIVAGGALAMALTLIAVTLAGVPVISLELKELAQRAEVLMRIDALPLPSLGEMETLGWLGRLAAAFLLATPVAFFLGGLHAAVNAVGERFVSVARFAPWGLLFIAASTLLALAPRIPIPFAVAAALLVPGSAMLGTSLAWGRRRDVTLTGPRLRSVRPAAIVAVVAILAVLAMLVPSPTSTVNRVHETSRFRDRFLLGSPVGRALAHFYYKHTLYAAEPLRPAYSSDDNVKDDRQLKTALFIGKFGPDVEALRAPPFNFRVERAEKIEAAAPLIAKRQHDLYVVANGLSSPFPELEKHDLLGRTIAQGGTPTDAAAGRAHTFPAPANSEDLQKALDHVFRLGGLETMLLELTWLGWTSVFYAGPIFVLLLAALPFAAILSRVSRHRSPQAVRRMVLGVFTASVMAIGLIVVLRWGVMSRVAALGRLPADDQKAIDLLAAGLRDADPEVRYEAAYQTYMKLKTTASFPRGGLTAELRAGAKDPSVRVRLWCASALGLTRDATVRPDILAAMDDPDLLVRYRAAEGLENLDSKRQPPPRETVEKLRDMMKTRSWYEGMYALEALRRIEPLKH